MTALQYCQALKNTEAFLRHMEWQMCCADVAEVCLPYEDGWDWSKGCACVVGPSAPHQLFSALLVSVTHSDNHLHLHVGCEINVWVMSLMYIS